MKLLTVFVLPLGWALGLGGAALWALARGWRRTGGGLLGLQLALLWLAAMPATAYWLASRLERLHPPVALEQTPVAEAAILLGGAVGPVGQPPTENLTGASDRVLRAARLFRAGKVEKILVSGGRLPWLGETRPESEAIRDLLIEWGVAPEAILLESSSLNTWQNARQTALLVREQGWQRMLLITSASHMPRALASFRKAGLRVIPSPTDYATVQPPVLDALDFLPDAGALAQSSRMLHEWIGTFYYRWRGWLE